MCSCWSSTADVFLSARSAASCSASSRTSVPARAAEPTPSGRLPRPPLLLPRREGQEHLLHVVNFREKDGKRVLNVLSWSNRAHPDAPRPPRPPRRTSTSLWGPPNGPKIVLSPSSGRASAATARDIKSRAGTLGPHGRGRPGRPRRGARALRGRDRRRTDPGALRRRPRTAPRRPHARALRRRVRPDDGLRALLTARIAHPEEFEADRRSSRSKFDNPFLDAIYSRFRDDSDGVIDVDELGLHELAERARRHRRRRAARRLRRRQPARRPGRPLLRGVPRAVRPRPAQGPRRLLHPDAGRAVHRQDRRRRSASRSACRSASPTRRPGRVRREAHPTSSPQACQARRALRLDDRPCQRHRHVPRRVDPASQAERRSSRRGLAATRSRLARARSRSPPTPSATSRSSLDIRRVSARSDAPADLPRRHDSAEAAPRDEELADPISTEGAHADEVKYDWNHNVLIGNPPYDRVESSRHRAASSRPLQEGTSRSLFDDIFDDAKKHVIFSAHASLYNLYVYFWRWAIWKVPRGEHRARRRCDDHRILLARRLPASSDCVGSPARWPTRSSSSTSTVTTRAPVKDENVFDIESPVAIVPRASRQRRRASEPSTACASYVRYRGTRDQKLATGYDLTSSAEATSRPGREHRLARTVIDPGYWTVARPGATCLPWSHSPQFNSSAPGRSRRPGLAGGAMEVVRGHQRAGQASVPLRNHDRRIDDAAKVS